MIHCLPCTFSIGPSSCGHFQASCPCHRRSSSTLFSQARLLQKACLIIWTPSWNSSVISCLDCAFVLFFLAPPHLRGFPGVPPPRSSALPRPLSFITPPALPPAPQLNRMTPTNR